jgi:FAD/FMN-containing dehydrogenase
VLFSGERPSSSKLLSELRRQLDPNGIMNPGALR